MNYDTALRSAQKTLTATLVAAVAAAGLVLVSANEPAADAHRPAVTAAKEWKRTAPTTGLTVVPAAKEWKRTAPTTGLTVVPAAKEWKRTAPTTGLTVVPAAKEWKRSTSATTLQA